VRQPSQPFIEIPDGESASIKQGEITRVNKQIPIRNIDVPVMSMRIGHQHQSNFLALFA